METALAKLTSRDAAQICQRFAIERPDEILPGEAGASSDQFLERLIEADRWLDAVRFLAYGLPTREAVWWASQCLRGLYDSAGAHVPVRATHALKTAEAWVCRPSADTRRAAGAVAVRCGYEDPWDWVAAAAHWSALPPLPSSTLGQVNLSAYAVESALTQAATFTGAGAADAHYRRFVMRGIDVANGGTGRIRDRQ